MDDFGVVEGLCGVVWYGVVCMMYVMYVCMYVCLITVCDEGVGGVGNFAERGEYAYWCVWYFCVLCDVLSFLGGEREAQLFFSFFPFDGGTRELGRGGGGVIREEECKRRGEEEGGWEVGILVMREFSSCWSFG